MIGGHAVPIAFTPTLEAAAFCLPICVKVTKALA
jgi:hypothetical protein